MIFTVLFIYFASLAGIKGFKFLYMILCCGGCEGPMQKKMEITIKQEALAIGGMDSMSKDIFADYRVTSLSKFYDRIQREYDEVCKQLPCDYIDLDHHGLIKERLKDRLRSIEEIIISHREILIYETGKIGEEKL